MAFKMMGKSPMTKALKGKQHNLSEELKAEIEASPLNSHKRGHDSAAVTNRLNEGDKKGARLERRRARAAAKNNTSRATRLTRKLKAHDSTDNKGKQKTRTETVSNGGSIEF